jgi:hypothetical protein
MAGPYPDSLATTRGMTGPAGGYDEKGRRTRVAEGRQSEEGR